MSEEFEIVSDEGKQFCKCRFDSEGNPIFIGKNCQISISRLMGQAYSRLPDRKNRSKTIKNVKMKR